MKLDNDKKKVDLIGNMKASFSGRKFRSGAYATVLSVVVIVIVLVVNLLFSKMDIQFDLSKQNMFTLSDETKEFLENLSDDITIYYIVQEGKETELYNRLVKQYDKLSDKIKVENKDPVLYPQFASQYVEEEVAENSFIVVNNDNGRAKYVNGSDMIIQEMNYNTYQYETTGIDFEGKLTSAIQYVTSDDLPKLYVVEGHGEAAPSESFRTSLDKMNVEIETISTLTLDQIPEDCDILFVNSPEKDFKDEETSMIKDYLASGGKAMITVDYKSFGLANFTSILDYYGIKMMNGVLLESDTNHYISGYPNYIIPDIQSHEVTSQASGSKIPVFMPISSGLAISDTTRNSLSVEPLLTSSASAYSKTDIMSSNSSKEEGDLDGPFYLALAASDTYQDVTSQVVVFSSEYTFSDDTANYGNASLLSGTISYLSEDMEALSIPIKSMSGDFIYATQWEAVVWGIGVATLGIPIIIFVIGSVICLKRRKK